MLCHEYAELWSIEISHMRVLLYMAYQGTSLLHFSHQRDQAGWCLKQYDGGMCALHCHQMYGSIYTLSTGWWSKTWTALNGQIGAPTYWWPIPPFSQVILLHQTMNIIIYFLLLASGSKKTFLVGDKMCFSVSALPWEGIHFGMPFNEFGSVFRSILWSNLLIPCPIVFVQSEFPGVVPLVID